MHKYKYIFFDLDHTLWDFDKNSLETLQELYVEVISKKVRNCSFENFFRLYKEKNEAGWKQYREGKVTMEILRVSRFHDTLMNFGVDDHYLANALAIEYLKRSPEKRNLLPFATEVLEYLYQKYPLFIITNGFQQVQLTKLKNSGIERYFKEIITSEKANSLKPSADIFKYALNKAGAVPEESIFIGDSLEVDVIGAKNAGWHQVYFNPKMLIHDEVVTHEISCLSELKSIL